MKNIIVVTFLVLLSFSLTESKLQINGTGTLLTKFLLQKWIFDYSFLQPDITIEYQALDEEINFEDGQGIQFFVEESTEDAEDMFVFPFAALAIVPVYNLPELNGQRLILSRENLGRIFVGNVTQWSDPRIVQDNLANGNVYANLPNAPILLVVDSNKYEATEIFTGCLNTFSPEWQATGFDVFSAWPTQVIDALPNVTVMASAERMASTVATTPYTISYASVDLVRCNALHDAALINKAGKVVTASVTSLVAAQETLAKDNFWGGSLFDTDGNGSWPIATYTWAYLDPNHQHCSTGRQLLKFWAWAIQSRQRRGEANYFGYAPLSLKFANIVVSELEKLECENKTLLTYDMETEHNGNNSAGLVGTAMALMVTWWIISAATFLSQQQRTIIPIIYSMLVVVGTTLGFISVIFWCLEPDQDWICQSRIWLAVLGLTVTCSAMFSRTLQMLTIYSTVVKGNDIRFNVLNWFHTFGAAGIIIMIQIILMTVFQIVDPWQSRIQVLDAINYTGDHSCSVSSAWLASEAVFFGLLFMLGLYAVYRTWEWEGAGTESRLLLVAIYTVFLIFTAFGLIIDKAKEDDDRVAFYVSIGLILVLISITSVVSIPFSAKVFVIWFKEHSSSFQSKTGSGSKSNTTTRVSGAASHAVSDAVEHVDADEESDSTPDVSNVPV